MPAWLIIVICVVAFLLIGGVIFTYIYCGLVAKHVYEGTLVRTSPEKWARACSAPDNEEHFDQWNRGLKWAEQFKDKMVEVEIENDGLHLYGEYFDFGGKEAVIIVPGRSESLMYSYYFAEPYYRCGMNILVIDIRAHGKSDGKYDGIGVGEDVDTMKWAQLLHERFGNEKVIIHGICMGANTGVLILSRDDCPDYIAGMVSEGMYISFYESYKQHMIHDHHPVFPVLPMVMKLIKKNTGTDVNKTRPIDLIDKVTRPVLFICGEQDPYSLPPRSRELYEKCGSPQKQIAWLPKGGHSHLRINNEPEFDKIIMDYVKKTWQ